MTIIIYTLASEITGSPVVLAIIDVLIFILTSHVKNARMKVNTILHLSPS